MYACVLLFYIRFWLNSDTFKVPLEWTEPFIFIKLSFVAYCFSNTFPSVCYNARSLSISRFFPLHVLIAIVTPLSQFLTLSLSLHSISQVFFRFLKHYFILMLLLLFVRSIGCPFCFFFLALPSAHSFPFFHFLLKNSYWTCNLCDDDEK